MKNNPLATAQKALLAISKDKETVLPKLSNPQNMGEYTRLVRGIHREAMNTAYPITKTKVGQEIWEDWLIKFLLHHPSQTKEIWKLPLEFLHYLKETQQINQQAIYLEDLMLFEWMEIETFNAEDVLLPTFQTTYSLEEKLLINPYVFLERLTYPVFKHLSEEEWGKHRGSYYLMCYRKLSDFRAYYSELHPTTIVVLDKLGDGMTGRQILQENKIPISSTELEKLFNSLLEKEIILGVLT